MNIKIVYVPVYHPEQEHYGDDYYDTKEEAIAEAERFISSHAMLFDEYLSATIEERVVLSYK